MKSKPVTWHLGVATSHTRVEAWESDFNQHWNARYYHRSFQLASERVATLCGQENPGTGSIIHRVVRFHRELFIGTAVEVRSVRIDGGALDGSVVHILSGDGTVSATALDHTRYPCQVLPAVDAEELSWAMPRSSHEVDMVWDPVAPDAVVSETGSVRREELDHQGILLMEHIIRRAGIAVHRQLARLGFTAEFTRATSVSRMAVELAVTPLEACQPGVPLIIKSRITRIREKSFSSIHLLETLDGRPAAKTVDSLVTVDLKTRRAVTVPEFIRSLSLE